MAEWVILELGPMAEGEDPSLVAASIRNVVGKEADVFIPAHTTQVGEDRVVTYLVDGYAFIKRERPDHIYYRLDETRYVRTVVRDFTGRGKAPACVTDRDIEKMRRQVLAHSDQGIDQNDTVVITNGPYKNLHAVVIEDIPEQGSVQVRVELRSKDSLVTLPRTFLALHSKAEKLPLPQQVRKHREWLNGVMPAVQWDPSRLAPVRQTYRLYGQLSGWLAQGKNLQSIIRLQTAVDRLPRMRESHRKLTSITRWVRMGDKLTSFVKSFETDLDATSLGSLFRILTDLSVWHEQTANLVRHVKTVSQDITTEGIFEAAARLDRLSGFMVGLLGIEHDLNSLERQIEGTVVVENIVIDGMNMAVRCSMAPGLGELRDTQGRPTGAVVGFLNSLVALHKRFPSAAIWVCWDNPSTRRRSAFPDYKANRGPHRHSFEVGFLKAALPTLGVWQVSAEGEEADDVVASLVRGRLEGQHNIIVSNDKDFMQLVTDTTHVLIPAVGSGKERLCTPDVVQAEYGVLPDRMVHLRALGGDTSDNIPGAPGCGNKTASKLLQLYGTVDGIYTSNLAGLSQSLCAKLRGAEKQVRLNLLLMTLVTDLALTLHAPDLNQTAAMQYLGDIDMNPARVSAAFFSQTGEVV